MHTLAGVGSTSAQAYLAHFVRNLALESWQPDHINAFLKIGGPHTELLGAFADRLDPIEAHEDDGSILLAAAHLASKARGRRSGAKAAVIARIEEVVTSRLSHGLVLDERSWVPLYNHTRHTASAIWDRMAESTREGWVAHHAQLDHAAHKWEVWIPTHSKYLDSHHLYLYL